MPQSSSTPRVVITGMSQISSLGDTPDQLWEALSTGRSGIRPLVGLPTDHLPVGFGGEAWGFTGKIDEFGPLEKPKQKQIRKGLKVMCREIQMAVATAQLALVDAGLVAGNFDPERTGVIFGSDYMSTLPGEFSAAVDRCTTGGVNINFERWGTDGLGQMAPLWLLKYLPNMPASHIAIFNDLRGPNNSITMREASANLAIGEAYHIIRRGAADILLTGATGTRIHPMRTLQTILQEQVATGDDPAAASRPFDLHRSGMVLGEGSGSLILERLETAQARGATIYGEVLGQGSSMVAEPNLIAHCDRALVNAMNMALRDAEVSADSIGHIHAHGLSTQKCDADEARAIGQVFGKLATSPPVTAIKGHSGNLGASSGVVEVIASLLAVCRGRLPPILNYDRPDPECPIHAAQGANTPAGDSFINLSVTPQGQGSAVIIRAFA